MSRILIVDDEPSICWALEHALEEDGHEVTSTATAEDAFEFVATTTPDVVVMDVRLPGLDGLSALKSMQERLGQTPIIMITAFGSLETAVEAIHRGAFEYLTKPFDLDDAIQLIRRALDSRQPPPHPPATPGDEHGGQLLLGSSAAMQSVFRQIAMVAKYDVPVLITGESGTGKELVATAIHHYSRRSGGPFVPVCIPAMSESLVESELFGHVEGAFTGAAGRRRGLLEAANQGTAFFDEIGEVALTTQVKLLRVLETRAVTAVGANDSRQSDFRLVAATNQNLASMVAEGKFREDLFYRLNVYQIEIPPLRQRREDIPELAQHFLRRLDSDGQIILAESAIEELVSREWSGNVRELRNTIEHAVIVTRTGEITPDCFPPPRTRDDADSVQMPLENAVRGWWTRQVRATSRPHELTGLYDAFSARVEPVIFAEALRLSRGNRQEAARLLGIHRQTLREKMRSYQLDADDFS